MTRAPRSISSANVYHIIFRGAGKQIVFEDNSDRRFFLRLLDKYVKELQGELYAWILMSDHVHLILHMPLESIATLMKKLGATYFRHFNDKTGSCGHVLQGRYHSEAISSDEYLMTCVRYVHQNIEKAGVCPMGDYEWSSYRCYTGMCHCPLVETHTDFVLEVFDGLDGFLRFHEAREYAVPCIDIGKTGVRMTDDEAVMFAKSLLGEHDFRHLKELEKTERNARLRMLKSEGLGVRQIGRLTGIGVSTISRA